MKRYTKLIKESQEYHYIAYRESVGSLRYKSIKPYREYLITTDETVVRDRGSLVCYDNVKIYTKENFKKVGSRGTISNKMVLIDMRNTCVYKDGRDNWIFEEGTIRI